MKRENVEKSEQPRIGRPPEPVPQDLGESVLEALAGGGNVEEWCRENGLAPSTVYRWTYKDDAFAQAFARAREVGADELMSRALTDIEKEPPRVDGKVDTGFVQWQSKVFEARAKIAACFSKRWREKQQHEHSGGVAIELVTGVPTSPTTTT